MEINLSLIFESSPDEEKRKCVYCKAEINGEKFQAVLQTGANVRPTDIFICEKCYQNRHQFSDKTETF